MPDITMQDAIDAGDGTLHGAIDYWQNRCAELEEKLKAAKSASREAALVEKLGVAAIYYAEAIDDIESWADYASEYFREKHDLSGCLEDHRSALAKIKEA